MKHILFILDYYAPHQGGAENVYQHIIEGLLSHGYRISIITIHFSPTLQQIETHGKLTIYRTGGSRKSFLWNAIKKGITILKKEKIDLIHTATYGGAIPARILAKMFHKKIIITVHEVFAKLWKIYKGRWGALPYQWFEKLIFTLPFDHYHCVSRYTMNSLRLCYGICDKKISMFYNGVDKDFWNPNAVSSHEQQIFKKTHGITSDYLGLYYGHAGKSKGLDFLISILPQLLAKHPNMQFVTNIIASKNSEQVLKKLRNIQKKCKKKHQLIIFEGLPLKTLRILVASTDFVIAPSLAEGFGSVHSEVSNMDKALITTPVAAIPEVVHGKVIFVAPQNSQAILDAIHDFQTNNYHTIEKKYFDWTITVKKIEQLYTTLLSL